MTDHLDRCFLCNANTVAGFGVFLPTEERCRRAVRSLTGTDSFPYWFCERHTPETAAITSQIEALILAMAEGGES